MTFREKWRRFLLITLSFSILFTFGYGYYYLKSILPDQITVVVDEDGHVNLHVPFSGTLTSEDSEVMLYDADKTVLSNTVEVGKGKSPILNASETGSYEIVYRLFGLFDFQTIQVEAVDDIELVPGGITMGLYLETDGVMVVGISEIEDINGDIITPAADLVEAGDYICAVGNQDIHNKEELIQCVAECDGQDLSLTLRRQDKQVNAVITPAQVSDSEYKLGIWVRDDCQGIGTVTYIDENGGFGALGHSISDVDTGMSVVSHDGELRKASIHSIKKGIEGTPGSVCGTISYDDDSLYGEIIANTGQGVFGLANDNGLGFLENIYDSSSVSMESIPVGYQQEVTIGKAYIRSAVSGELEDYEINITAVDTSKGNKNKGIVLEVTDDRLLDLTGGIVQGMSGSPIIQNGKIIGAVTHVFVQDAAKGYGIFIEKMLDAQHGAEGY